jgi:hypothetical protein
MRLPDIKEPFIKLVRHLKKKPWQSTILLIIGISTCILVFSVLSFIWASLQICSNDIKSEIPSPDNSLVAVIFSRDCGATTGFSIQLSIIPAGSKLPNEIGNVFIEDSGSGGTKEMPIYVKWNAAEELSVSYNPSARVFLSKKNVKVQINIFQSKWVRVSYRPLKVE